MCFTAVGLTPGGSSTVHIYTQHTEYRERNIHNNKKIGTRITINKFQTNLGSATMPRLCELYPSIWLTTEEEARKNLI
jgi:hypothetical protein